MRHKKMGLGLAVLVLLLSAVLGATVLREPIARAATATPFQDVLVTNTAANPVPVTQTQPVTELVGKVTLGRGQANGNSVEMDVNRYRQIRVGIGDVLCGSDDSLTILAKESPDASNGLITDWDFCAGSTQSRVFDMPGRTLNIRCFCFGADDFVKVTVWGRTG